jgi:hypothetical protein
MMPFSVQFLSGVTFRIDGTVIASSHWRHWPVATSNSEDHQQYQHFWTYSNSESLTFEGKGVIEGQGYMWWIREILQMNIHQRPNLVEVQQVVNFEWSGIGLRNSP